MRFALIALVGCASIPPIPQPTDASAPSGEHAVFAVPGEKLVYRVALRGITVGSARVAIGEPGTVDGKRSIIARTRAETVGMLALIGTLAWELHSTIDLDRGMPIVSREEFWAELAGEKDHAVDTDRRSDSDEHHDVHSAVGRFRGWRSKPGDRMEFQLRVGKARLGISARHAGREYLPRQKAHAIRYEGSIAERFSFTAWVSDDPSRAPLKFHTDSKWGAIDAELVDYRLEDR